MSLEEDKEQVRRATDLVALVAETVVLRQRGGEFWGCCPFHREKTPSFKVNPSTGLWKCFGCGKGGDVFSYVMERENLDFMDALRYLAERAGIELSRDRSGSRGPARNRLKEAVAEAESFYTTMLLRGKAEGAARARSYLKGRGFGSEVCRRWGLGYAPGHGALVAHLTAKGFTRAEMVACDLAVERSGSLRDRFFDRAIFPIHDEHGSAIGLGGRVLGEGMPKYLNSRDTAVFHKGRNLYAYDRAKEHVTASGEAVVCEGYTDVISMHEAGIANTVATLGTALTLDHVRLLERCRVSRVVLMFDGDAAGQRAAERAVLFLPETTADLRCVILPDGLDPAEFLEARGADELRGRIAGARPLIDFVLEARLASYDLSVPGRRVAALRDGAALLAPLKRSVLLDEYATRLADAVGADVAETKRMVRATPVRHADEHARRDGADAGPDEAGGRGPDAAPRPREAEPLAALSADERAQLRVERELLAQMVGHPDEFRAQADRIAELSWTDSRHEAIAWAVLATPERTSPEAEVRAAAAVVPEAPRILAGATLDEARGLRPEDARRFLLDTVELYSVRRRVRSIRARLSGGADGADADLFGEATRLQRRANELVAGIRAMIDSASNG